MCEGPMNQFFISDTQFDHANIIRYCHRPFGSVEEMNFTILENWLRAVKPGDTVYFLGDLAYGPHCRPAFWLSRLTGNIVFIKGNHDHGRRELAIRAAGVTLYPNKTIITGAGPIYLVHDPADIPSWWQGWVVHGHLHHKAPLVDRRRKRINVSAEATGYHPVSLGEIERLCHE
jgi:calcineurin-like phosphoesterase family protein